MEIYKYFASTCFVQGFFDKGGKSSKGDHHKSHKHGGFKKGKKGGKGHKKGSKGSFGKGHSKKVIYIAYVVEACPVNRKCELVYISQKLIRNVK